MLNFIVPLKARAISSNWDTVCRVFETTLGSIYNQTDPDFRVTVICHDRPTLQNAGRFDERTEWICVDFPIPGRNQPVQTSTDKYKKLAMGYNRARAAKADFTMLVDADDLISNRLAAHANANRQSNGWSIGEGYVFDQTTKTLLRRSNFQQICGTSAIINTRLYRFPDADDFGGDEAFERARQQCAPLGNGHANIANYLAKQGTPLENLPFAGAIYVRGHGDNDSLMQAAEMSAVSPTLRNRLGNVKRTLYQMPNRQTLTAAIRQEFGVPDSF